MVHLPVFRTEQLQASRAVIACCLNCIGNFLHRNGTQSRHQTMAMVENAERQILTVIDVEHKQLVLRNLFDVLDICALVMQIHIDAVYSQTNAVTVDCLHNLQCLTHAVAAPLLIADRLKGQLDAIRLCDVCELIEHLYGVIKYFLLVLGANFRRHGRNNDNIRVSNLLCNFTAKGK